MKYLVEEKVIHIGVALVFALPLLGVTACADQETGSTQGKIDEEQVVDRNVEPAAEEATLSLNLAWSEEDTIAVDLLYNPGSEKPGPRMAEFYFDLSGELAFVKGEPLAAVTEANKELVVQQTDDGKIRSVIYATSNLTRLQAGPLARYLFTTGSGDGRIEILDRRPIFAPSEAEAGIALGKPLVVGGP